MSETKAIQVAQQHHVTAFEPAGLEEAYSLSQRLSKSGLVPDALRGKPDDILVVLMTGRELGLQPMQSLRTLAVVKGKAAMSADLMVGLVLAHKDVCEYFRLAASDDKVATYETKRAGSAPVKMSFSIQQAQQAGLAGKGTWQQYPAAMLRARCSAALARAVYPDLCAGIYESGEAEDIQRGGLRPAPMPMPEPVGEVVEATVVPEPTQADFAAPPDVDVLTAAIAAAPNLEALKSVVPGVKNLPKEAQDVLRQRYSERRAELTGTSP